jgi:hypothetical protein
MILFLLLALVLSLAMLLVKHRGLGEALAQERNGTVTAEAEGRL